jgi:simple sugar transport system permease protein
MATIGVFLVLYTIGAILYQGFFSVNVFIDFLSDYSFLGIVAVGMTLVIVSGGIDLSVGAVLALCTVVMATLMKHNLDPVVTLPIALTIGTTLGLLMGCIIHFFKIEPFIATLAGMFLARGLALIVSTQTIDINTTGKFYSWVTNAGLPIGGTMLPIPAIILLIVVGAGFYISTFTSFGRNLYAIGGNEKAAHLMGLPIGRTKILVYTLCGFCAALAAVVHTFYQPSGDPNAAIGMELDAIAVAVIGGTLLTGGVGNIFGTLTGLLIFGVIQTGINFQGTLSSWWAKVAIGGLLLAFIILQKFLSRRQYQKT